MDLSSAGGALGAGASTTVTVSITNGANSLTAGSYSDTVIFFNTTNSNGNTTWSVSLTVQSPPGTFAKTSPANNATNQATNPTLSWGTSSGATSYEYCIDTTNNNACDSGTWTTTNTATSVALSGLTPGATYYWQVQARNAAGPTAASGGWWSFTVSCPTLGAPTLASPANGATGISSTPMLDWADVTGAATYDVQICSDAACKSVVQSQTGLGASQWTVGTALNNGGTYYWRARAVNSCGNGSWSQTWSLTTVGIGNVAAARDLPSYYAPAQAVIVMIVVTPDIGTKNYAVEDMVPAGWVVNDISHSGLWVSGEKKVKWGPFFDHTARTLTFKATPPAGETGAKTFSGTASFDGINTVIGGDTTFNVTLKQFNIFLPLTVKP